MGFHILYKRVLSYDEGLLETIGYAIMVLAAKLVWCCYTLISCVCKRNRGYFSKAF